jgi:hypothetical protein
MMNETMHAMPPVKARSFPWQFNIKAILATTTACCLLLAMATVPPLLAIVLTLFHLAAAIAMVTAAIYGRGWIRPFSILAGISLAIGFLMILAEPMPAGAAGIALLFNLAISMAVGLCGAVFQGYLVRRGGFIPIPNLPLLRDTLVNPRPESADKV